jgi:DNA-nicking Smr family endonuclease
MAKGKKKKQRRLGPSSDVAAPKQQQQPAEQALTSWVIDLHGHTQSQAVSAVRRALSGAPPHSSLELITGQGNHSAQRGVSVIKERLEELLSAWQVPWRWDRGVFTCEVPTAEAQRFIAREDSLGGGGGGAEARQSTVQLAAEAVSAAAAAPSAAAAAAPAAAPCHDEFPSLTAAQAMQQSPTEAALCLSKLEARAHKKGRRRQQQEQQHRRSGREDSSDDHDLEGANVATTTMDTSLAGDGDARGRLLQLQSMGFSAVVARQALSAAAGDLCGAMDWALAISVDAPCGASEWAT